MWKLRFQQVSSYFFPQFSHFVFTLPLYRELQVFQPKGRCFCFLRALISERYIMLLLGSWRKLAYRQIHDNNRTKARQCQSSQKGVSRFLLKISAISAISAGHKKLSWFSWFSMLNKYFCEYLRFDYRLPLSRLGIVDASITLLSLLQLFCVR